MIELTRRTRRTLWTIATVVAVLALAIFLRSKAPPEAARLLPESDGILYANLKPFHNFLHKSAQPPTRVPEYQQFVEAVGVDWEQDLDQVAIALHRMSDPSGPNGPVAYSMVLQGKLTGQKLNAWLAAHATARETYAGHTVFSIPSENRTVRVAQIGYDMLAVSNFPTPEMIHSILDRHSTAAWPFAGSTLLSHHYSEIPMLSVAWGLGQIGLPFSESGSVSAFGFPFHLPDDTTLVASIAPALSLGSTLRLRVEEIAPSPAVASSQAAQMNAFLVLARGLAAPLGNNTANNGLRELLKTAEVSADRNRVVVKATLSAASIGDLALDEQFTSEAQP